jgi:hypothetical protein
MCATHFAINSQLEPNEEIADHEGTGTNNDFGIQNRILLSPFLCQRIRLNRRVARQGNGDKGMNLDSRLGTAQEENLVNLQGNDRRHLIVGVKTRSPAG